MGMKSWEEMTSKERAEQTIKDIKRRQELRKIGEREAKSFICENAYKSNRKSKTSKKRGCRSCK